VPRIALLVSTLLALGCGAPLAPPTPAGSQGPRYAAVIDAGSSGSRIHVYRWRPRAPLPWVEEGWRLRVEPGLSAFAGEADAVAEHLTPLIEFALDRISGDGGVMGGGERPLLLLEATGGLRALEAPVRDDLLASARAYLETTPFELTGVEVIDGRSEGLYGWITVNYLLGRLASGGPTAAALDLGGVSTQIAFEPSGASSERTRLTLGGREWSLYVKSYAGLGQDEAREAAASAACFPSGFPLEKGGVGIGDYPGCRRDVLRYLAPRLDPDQPALVGEIFAFSAFYYAADFFGLEDTFSLAALEAAGVDYCARPWSELEVTYRDRLAWDPYVPRHCFTAAFVVALLHDGYGLTLESDQVQAVSTLAGQDVGWTLGSLLFELAAGGQASLSFSPTFVPSAGNG
jgi:hypothetical protein